MKSLAPLVLLLTLSAACDSAQKPLLLSDVHLQRFSTCQALDAARVQRSGSDRATDFTAEGAPTANETATAQTQGETNIQVAGVDELDVAKADGDFIYSLSTNRTKLSVLKRSPANSAAVVQTVDLGDINAQGLFITADHVIVLGDSAQWFGLPGIDPWMVPGGLPAALPMALMSSYSDVSLPGPSSEQIHIRYFGRAADGTLAASIGVSEVDGHLITARLIGNFLHLAAGRYIGLVGPSGGVAVGEMPDAVLPQGVLGDSSKVRLADCTDILHEPAIDRPDQYTFTPPEAENLFGVISIDTANLSSAPQSVWIAGNSGSTIFASAKNLFAASYGWGGAVPIHQFSLANGNATTAYVGSALIEGQLLNQYSMDEFDGNLRVATTVEPEMEVMMTTNAAPAEGVAADAQVISPPISQTDNRVTVFRLTGGDLEKVGAVKGLGAGERIYAVRFMGTRGFVVTFHQIDPLYALDLSDPASPTVRGALKVTGFSNYLHPMADGYLLGIGRNADEAGHVHLGMLLSIFDVRDLDHPALLQKLVVGTGETSSEAENDPHAFRFVPETSQLILPVDLMISTSSWTFAPEFQIYDVSLTGGFSLVGTSKLQSSAYATGNRSFFRDGVISLLGGGELALRNSDHPDTDASRITTP